MKITSPLFEHNEAIPSKYTCDLSRQVGGNVNPPLKIEGVPEGAKSIVLIMDDPDATRGLWVHWVLWNLSPDTKEIPENSVPAGAVEGTTSFGKPGYGGPCPPSGTHRYFFKLYALNGKLELPPSAGKAELEEAMAGQVLDQVELIGLYSRQ